MNLPASATEFLDVFRGVFADRKHVMSPNDMPTIHCYCFSKDEDEDYAADAVRLCEAGLGGPIVSFEVHEVRDVAPRKRMLCVSFVLPTEIAFDAEPAPVVPVLMPTPDFVGDGDATGIAGAGGAAGGAAGDGPPPSKKRRAEGDSVDA